MLMNTYSQSDLLSKQDRISIFLVLVILLVSSEGHHVISAFHFPDPTLAVYFLAGRYIRQWQSWPALFLVTFACDYFVINYRGVSNYCFTSSYAFLTLAYGAMWLGGFLSRSYQLTNMRNILTLSATISLSTLVAFLISNGSFYWLSGRYPEPHVAQYIERVAMYLPGYMKTPWIWLGVAAAIEFIVTQIQHLNRSTRQHS